MSGKNAYTRHTFSTISVQHTFINQGLSCHGSHVIFTGTTTTTTTVLWLFFQDYPGEPVPEENFWTLWCKERLTEADTLILYHPAGRHSIRTNQCSPPPSPHIFTGTATELSHHLCYPIFCWTVAEGDKARPGSIFRKAFRTGFCCPTSGTDELIQAGDKKNYFAKCVSWAMHKEEKTRVSKPAPAVTSWSAEL